MEYQPLISQASKVVNFSAPHVVPQSNTFCRYVTHDSEGQQLDFRSAKRECPVMRGMLTKLLMGLHDVRGDNGSSQGLVVAVFSWLRVVVFHSLQILE